MKLSSRSSLALQLFQLPSRLLGHLVISQWPSMADIRARSRSGIANASCNRCATGFATIEVIIFLKRFSIRQQGAAYAAVVAALAALVIAGPVGDIISKRFAGMVEYYDSGDSSQWEDKVSADIREVMWKNAAKVIEHNPIAGVGSYSKWMSFVRRLANRHPCSMVSDMFTIRSLMNC